MKKPKRRYTRKQFIRTSSMGVMATGMLTGTSANLLAGTVAKLPAGDSAKIPTGASAKPPVGTKALATSTLGNTGIRMTKLGVGAPRIQEPSVLRYALDNGITFIDTGRGYANGKNEEMVGEAVKGKRKDYVIQSKVQIRPDSGIGALDSKAMYGWIRDTFNKSLEESLKALQTDYIDVLLFHDGDSNYLYHDAVLEAFSKAKQAGKIRATGFSVHSNLVDIMARHNRDPLYDVIMLSFNPHGGYQRRNRDVRWDQSALIAELKKAADAGTGIVAMKTCLGGTWRCEGDAEATYPGAVKWVLEKPYIHTSAVAMASFQQLDEHMAVHKT